MSWYLLRAKPHQDVIADENLRRQGFICFRPKCRIESKLHGKLKIKEESLFPGYMFIRLLETDNWSPVRSTLGVNDIVRFGGRALPVAESVVEGIRERMQEMSVIRLFDAGDRVYIKSGVFEGLEAVYCCAEGRDRVVVLLDFLGYQQRVTVPTSLVSAGF